VTWTGCVDQELFLGRQTFKETNWQVVTLCEPSKVKKEEI